MLARLFTTVLMGKKIKNEWFVFSNLRVINVTILYIVSINATFLTCNPIQLPALFASLIVIFLFITVTLLWNYFKQLSLCCIKCYINKGDLTWIAGFFFFMERRFQCTTVMTKSFGSDKFCFAKFAASVVWLLDYCAEWSDAF